MTDPGIDMLAAALARNEAPLPPPFRGTVPVDGPADPAGDEPVDEVPATPPAGATPTADPEELRRVGAEVVSMIEHHRRELEATMTELTRMQRAIRQEARDLVEQLERLSDVPSVDLTDSGGPTDLTDRPRPATLATAPAKGGRPAVLRLGRNAR